VEIAAAAIRNRTWEFSMTFVKLSASALAIAAVSATAAAARDNVQIAGSSTVLPYASIVAEAFGENFDFPTPVVESGGSSAGLKRFCEGVGENTIDIANASRAIREGEIETCAANGVTDIIEVRIGYDGIVFASQIDGPAFNAFEPSDWYKALAAEHPVDGEMVENQNMTWADVNPDLPDVEIAAYIPGTKHGTREVFEEKVLLQGCEDTGAMQAMMDMGMSEDDAEDACMAVRTDGKSVDIDGDYTETLARIDSNPEGLGVFGLAFYENNTDKLKVATMSGVEPTVDTIASGEYPVSRPLFFYIKKAHIGVIPGLKEYAEFFVSDAIAGPRGPLAQYGLVSDPELDATQEKVANEVTMGESM
jgi:phosphate transport system substrate-binding protein